MKIAALLIVLLPGICLAQFSDDFSDGDFSGNPIWEGESALFTVNAGFQLQTQTNSLADTAFLTTACALDFTDTITWEFYWRMNFAPSDNNNSRVYLSATSAQLTSSANQGYYLKIGESGNDSIRLFRANGTNSTLLATGAQNYSANPAITVKVIRYPNGTWELFADPAAGNNFALEATVQDNSVVSGSYFGLWCKYTTTNSSKFYFDDITVSGTTFVDNVSPSILSANAIGQNQLLLTFNEPLDSVSAENALNYTVNNGIGQAALASISNAEATEVLLSFGNNFPVAQACLVQVSNVEDINGNPISLDTATFIYYVFAAPVTRCIVINEIMADPTPTVSLPEVEFVELHNPTNDFFFLDGATLSDPSTTSQISGFHFIAPGEYITLCHEDDAALFSGKVIGMATMPSLNNTGDVVSLTVQSELVDVVAYSDSWYGDALKKNGGYTLELINPVALCSGSGNWKASVNPNGGTPGSQNSIYSIAPDTIIPSISDVNFLALDSIDVVFSESMDSASLATATFTIQGGPTVLASVIESGNFDHIWLILSAPLDSGVTYSITCSGATDCEGNQIASSAYSFGLGVSARPFDLVFNELYPDPAEGADLPPYEFVEFFNRSGQLISTEGLSLADKSSSSALYSAEILPNEYFIVCDDANEEFFSAFAKVVPVGSMPSLNNTGDDIKLLNGTKVVDRVGYLDSWYGNRTDGTSNVTLEKIDPENICGLASNWTGSSAEIGGTPGVENAQFKPSQSIGSAKLVEAGFVSNNSVLLTFDRSMDSLSLISSAAIADDNALSVLSISADFSGIIAKSAIDFVRGTQYTFSVSSVFDCAQNPSSASEVMIYLPDSADIVINEVLFNPRGSGSDYVELFNHSEFEINLNSWKLGYLDSKDSLIFKEIATVPLYLKPQHFIALNEDSADVVLNYPFAESLWQIDLPTYSNTEGSVRLFDPLSFEIDRFDYTEDLHFALIDDVDGVSLERLDPLRSAKDKGNWHSASSQFNYGTPGFENSQHYPSQISSAPFTLSAEFISPDNDGYQDVVNIEYSDIVPRTMASVKVYTDLGFYFADVATNILLGERGSITWDGTNAVGEKAASGIYVIWVSTFNLTGERMEYRLPVVVATKLN